MESKIEISKKDFNLIIEVCDQMGNIFNNVYQNIKNLKNDCQDFIKLNEDKKIFIFCLDSLQFQCKVIDIEFDDIKRLWFSLNNRIYCEYYKLYRLVIEYIYKEHILILENDFLLKKIPVYKDLEPFRQYEMTTIKLLHLNIIELLNKIYQHICIKEIEFKKYQEKQEKGFNMQNFVATFNYTVTSIKQKYDLFLSYLDFFHSMHLKYLRRLLTKICLFENQLNKDICLDNEVISEKDDNLKTYIQLNEELPQTEQQIGNNAENITLTLKQELEENKNIKYIFQKNVKKIINGLKLFRTKIDKPNNVYDFSNNPIFSLSMCQIEKNISFDIKEATAAVNTIMVNSSESVSNNSTETNKETVINNILVNEFIFINEEIVNEETVNEPIISEPIFNEDVVINEENVNDIIEIIEEKNKTEK